MTFLEQLDFDALLKIYLFANTPKYLYRHFRENETLTELTKRISPEVLLVEYHKLHNKKDRTLSDIVLAYALIIALTHYNYTTALDVIRKLDTANLEWGSEIKDISLTHAKAVNTAYVKLMPITPTTSTLTTFTSSVTHNYRKIKIG